MGKDERIDLIVANDLEWRKYILKGQDELRDDLRNVKNDLSSFKLKMIGYVSSLVVVAELGLKLLTKG